MSNKIEQLKALNSQYRELRNKELIYRVELHTTNGVYGIGNHEVINKIVDLLISESQKQIEKEVNE